MKVHNNQPLAFKGIIRLPHTKENALNVAFFESNFRNNSSECLLPGDKAIFRFYDPEIEARAIAFLAKFKMPFVHETDTSPRLRPIPKLRGFGSPRKPRTKS